MKTEKFRSLGLIVIALILGVAAVIIIFNDNKYPSGCVKTLTAHINYSSEFRKNETVKLSSMVGFVDSPIVAKFDNLDIEHFYTFATWEPIEKTDELFIKIPKNTSSKIIVFVPESCYAYALCIGDDFPVIIIYFSLD